MMVIDPNGRDVMRNKKTLGNKVYLPLPIEEIDTTVSARRLRDIFVENGLELRKLMRFLEHDR